MWTSTPWSTWSVLATSSKPQTLSSPYGKAARTLPLPYRTPYTASPASKIGNRPYKPFIRQPVIRTGITGLKPSQQLMFALGARIKVLQAMGNAVINPLVVTGLEMQVVVLLQTSPVAAIEPGGIFQEPSRGDHSPFPLGND